MKSKRAYDLPIRIFHWSFATLFVVSFIIGKFVDDESRLYAYHMLSGLMMLVLVFLRVIWGFIGSRTSRFTAFILDPNEIVSYFSDIFTSSTKRYLGHNPASSYVTIILILLTLAINLTGMMMLLGISKHFFEEVHEVLAHLFLITTVLHIGGVLFHQLCHNDGMITSMINGKKLDVENESEIRSNHIIVAIVFVVLILSSGQYLLNRFDHKTGEISLFGNVLQLTEIEHENKD
ncbi:prokaryotic cytochrome b561 [Bacteriovorax sp. BSW11_IV]|uniref:cytochrome b/b6 domain-containing protein n=1 Tax=Bacteriovorax sp. BSW11_IV TaxID=1353529 RepID=UPI000389DA1F|nr:cytochrome b/b6 domain-containing protein [Bacteriovorax sp. BSW11_IV]EQC48669.1 prokaryotic cytochrome b561 [Bacteriovorax sp. BSW11_IV]